jgi:hypothetical protein
MSCNFLGGVFTAVKFLERLASFFFFFFGRTTALGRIITVDYLIKRNTIVVDWCCMCK